MKKNILLFAALGIGAFLLLKNKDMFAAKGGDEEEGAGTEGAEPEEPTAVETMNAQPGKVQQTLQAAKNLVEGAKNIVVSVRTPEGKEVRVARKSKLIEMRKKRRADRKLKIEARRKARLARRKSRKQKTATV